MAALLLALVGCLLAACEAQVTVTVVTTSTAVSTSTVTVSCTQLINITAACRRRRGIWLEEPVILSFDEPLDDFIPIIAPAPVHLVEVTAMPMPLMNYHLRGTHVNSRTTVPSNVQLQSSLGRSRGSVVSPAQEARFGFQLLFNLLQQLFPQQTTVTTTSTQTTTAVALTTLSNTEFIMGCTTSPFTGDICARRRG